MSRIYACRKATTGVHAIAIAVALFAGLVPSAAAADGDDPLKPFPLLEHGLVAGAGLGLHAPGLGSGTRQTDVATTGFAYVAVVPAYWFLGDVTRKYCASTGDPQGAANLFAAQKRYPNTSSAVLTKKLAPKPEFPDPSDAGTVQPFTADEKASITASTGWDLTRPGSCFSHLTWLGLFAALPGSYTTNVLAGGVPPTLSKEVHPYGAFGLLFAVRPYAHVLAGLTIAHTAIGPSDTSSEQNMISLFFGLGTTIDVLGAVFK